MAEHTKNARPSTHQKHTRPRAGASTASRPNFTPSKAGKAAVKARHQKNK